MDVFQTIKNLRIQRPAMVQTLVCVGGSALGSSALNLLRSCSIHSSPSTSPLTSLLSFSHPPFLSYFPPPLSPLLPLSIPLPPPLSLSLFLQEQYQFCYNAALDYLEASDLINQLRSSTRSDTRPSRTASNASDLRSSRRSRSPARSDSVRSAAKRSSRNLELSQMGNGVSTVYGGSEATSTFGTSQHLHPPTAGSTADSSSLSQGTVQGAEGLGSPSHTPVPSQPPLPPSASPAAFPRHLLANPHLAHLDTGGGGGSQSPLSSMQGSSPYLSAQGSAPQLHSAAVSSGSYTNLSQGEGHSPSSHTVFQTNTLPAYHTHRSAASTQPGQAQWGVGGASASQGSLTGPTGPAHGSYPTSTFGVSSGAGQRASEESLEHKMAAMTLNLNNSNNNIVDVYVET